MSFTTEIPALNQPNQSCRANVVKLLLMGPANAGKTVIGKKLEETFNCSTMRDESKLELPGKSYLPTPGIDFYRILPQDNHRSYVLWELGGWSSSS